MHLSTVKVFTLTVQGHDNNITNKHPIDYAVTMEVARTT